MKPSAFRILAAAILAGISLTAPVHAASNQYVIVVAEGLSPQVAELGNDYLRTADQDPEEITAFHNLETTGQKAVIGPDALSELKGLLETADDNGYKTGFVTTGDIATDAALFYNLPADPLVALTSPEAKYDFIAGGGRAKLPEETAQRIRAAGGTYLPNEDSLAGEITGRVLAPQAEEEFDYSIDRDPSVQAGLHELTALAIETMGAGDAPFVLIVHDTLTKKALETKDTPALVEQFRELNSIVADATTRRQENLNFKSAYILTGGVLAPRFNTTVEEEKANSLEVLSNLLLSFSGAGKKLEGADEDALLAFTDPIEGLYRNWPLTPEVRTKILDGSLAPEVALRAAYEPMLKLSYDAPAQPPMAYLLGFETRENLATTLKAAVADKVVAPPPPVEAPVNEPTEETPGEETPTEPGQETPVPDEVPVETPTETPDE